MTETVKKPFEDMSTAEKVADRQMRLARMSTGHPDYVNLDPTQWTRIRTSLNSELQDLKLQLAS